MENMETILETALEWRPQVKERPRFVKATGRTYTPKNTLAAEAAVREQFQDRHPMWVPYDKPCRVEFTFTNSHIGVVLKEHADYEARQVRGDVDNYCKMVSDALNGTLYDDDKRIVALEAMKL